MRIRIAHETTYLYDEPATGVIQTLRMTPRSFDGHYVANWHIDVDQDCKLEPHEDAFGNLTHTFTLTGKVDRLTVRAEGLVETSDTNGIVRGSLEKFPPALFLRETGLTATDPAIRAYADAIREKAGGEPLATLHALMGAVHADFVYDKAPTQSTTTAEEAFALKRGVCQDFAHVFIACARHLGLPARYVGGYYLDGGTIATQDAGHGWAEAFVDGLGWIGFDPANDVCPTWNHIRVAVGLDYLGAAPVRGTRYGGGAETMSVSVQVDQARRQIQE
ncbi:MAG: transglutaminase family protein [Alphaproteobacteria bacterium]